jgi:acetyl/propionyl-CoA carboxylase alpha subunit
VTAFLGQNQSQLSQLINYRDQVQKLIASNEGGQTNADITKEQAQIQFDATKTQLDDALKKAELALRQATTARDFARKNQDIQLRLLQNTINSAEVNYQDAVRNAAKLSIAAPLDGQVADILVDV